VPEQRTGRLPAITMAHGYAGTKYHGIEPMAQAFADAGFVVLLSGSEGRLGEQGHGALDAVVSQVRARRVRRPSIADASPHAGRRA
jgi:hypothetical protein